MKPINKKKSDASLYTVFLRVDARTLISCTEKACADRYFLLGVLHQRQTMTHAWPKHGSNDTLKAPQHDKVVHTAQHVQQRCLLFKERVVFNLDGQI